MTKAQRSRARRRGGARTPARHARVRLRRRAANRVPGCARRALRSRGRRPLHGLLLQPYALLQNPGARIVSGFFGPIERMARAAGARVTYLPRDFNGLERLGTEIVPRVVMRGDDAARRGRVAFLRRACRRELSAVSRRRPRPGAARDRRDQPPDAARRGHPRARRQPHPRLRGRRTGRARRRSGDAPRCARVGGRPRDRAPGRRADRAERDPPVRHRRHPERHRRHPRDGARRRLRASTPR